MKNINLLTFARCKFQKGVEAQLCIDGYVLNTKADSLVISHLPDRAKIDFSISKNASNVCKMLQMVSDMKQELAILYRPVDVEMRRFVGVLSSIEVQNFGSVMDVSMLLNARGNNK